MLHFLSSGLNNFRKFATLMVCGLLLATGAAQATDNPGTPESSGSIVADGMLIYYAILPAGMLRQFPKGSGERLMHGGVPHGLHWHHVMVAVFDKATYERITDVTVAASVTDLGMATEDLKLQPSDVGGGETFMNYFQFDQSGIYTIDLEITRQGTPTPITAQFRYRHH